MNPLLSTSLPLYKSKEIAWVNGSDYNVFDPLSFMPKEGPNGGVPVIDFIIVHLQLNVTTTIATLVGADVPRFVREVTIEQYDDEKRVAACRGDSLYDMSFVELGEERTHVHADVATGAGQTVNITLCIPMAKLFMYEPDDCSIPAYALRSINVRMADAAYASLGATVVINSGKTWVTVMSHEEIGVVQHAVDCLYEHDFDTTEVGEIVVGGRPQSLIMMIPGAGGGQTLANLSTVMVEGIHKAALYKSPDLQTNFARSRSCANGLFSTTGNPVRTNPFTAADAGTLRALAVLLTTGNKCWDAPELNRVSTRITFSAALPATPRIVLRAMKRKTARMRELIMDTFDVDASYIKSADKTRKDIGKWDPKQAIYLPEKFYKRGADGRPLPGMPKRR